MIEIDFDTLNEAREKHPHYFREINGMLVDFYRNCEIWDIDHPAQAHALKKIMFAGVRPDESKLKDIEEAIHSLRRWQQMILEDQTIEVIVSEVAGGSGKEEAAGGAPEIVAGGALARVLAKTRAGRVGSEEDASAREAEDTLARANQDRDDEEAEAQRVADEEADILSVAEEPEADAKDR